MNRVITPPKKAESLGRRLLIAIAAWIGLSVVVGFATVAVANAIAPEWAADPDSVAAVITTEVYALLVAAMLLVVGRGGRARTALGLRPVSTREIGLAIAALAGGYAASVVIYLVVSLFATPDPSAVDIVLGIGADGGRLANAGSWTIALIFTRILILVPLGEELLFRGALFSFLRRRLSGWTTIGISALLFAAIHGFLVILPAAFIAGLAFGWVRERTGSVIPGIIAHSVNGIVLITASWVFTDWTARLPF